MLLKPQSLAHVRFSMRKPGIIIELFVAVVPDSVFFRVPIQLYFNHSTIYLLSFLFVHKKLEGGIVALDGLRLYVVIKCRLCM